MRNAIPIKYQQNVETYRPLTNCMSTLVFGWLSVSISFRYLYSTISFLLSFTRIFFSFTFQSPIIFTTIILINSMGSLGLGSICFPHLMKVYGLNYYISINALISFSSLILSPILSVFMFYFDDKFTKDNQLGIALNNN